MNKVIASLAIAIFCLNSNLARSDEVDPLSHNLIFVEGEAQTMVSVDGFSLALEFEVERASFEEGSQQSARIADEVSKRAKELGFSHIEIAKGWDVVRQAKISRTSKARKITNRLMIRVWDFPQGKLHESIAQLIDEALAVDGSIVLNEVNVMVSEKTASRAKESAVAEALKTLQSNAAQAASNLGRKLSEPKRVFITSDANIYRSDKFAQEERGLFEMRKTMDSFISIQKSFNVNAEIADQMKVVAKVTAVYEII